MESTSDAAVRLNYDNDDANEEDDDEITSLHRDGKVKLGDISKNRSENQYIDNQIASSDLHLHDPKACQQAFLESGPLGLFLLFIPPRFIDRFIFKATKQALEEKQSGQRAKIVLTTKALRCVLGLDIAMSLCNSTQMKELWSQKMFLGSSAFSSTMSRDTFVAIRGSLRIYSQSMAKNPDDPLWSMRAAKSHILRNFASVAQPIGPIALDEASCPTKARTRASTYIPSKPDKFAIRYYAVVGWTYTYTFGLWDNGSGSTVNQTPAEQFLKLFGELTCSFNQLCQATKSRIRNACPVAVDSASMLWVLMLGLLYRALVSAKSTRPREKIPPTIVYMDNFYTRHSLGRAIDEFTDGNIKITGTVRLNLVDKINKTNVTKAMKYLDGKPRGSWVLVKAFNAVVHPEKEKQKQKEKQKEYSKTLPRMKVGFEVSDIVEIEKEYAIAADCCGYIVYLDKKPVVFYTNDLFGTPSKTLLYDNDEEAVEKVHGLATLWRWIGHSMHIRHAFKAPAPVVAYNLFMNGVDRADQMRATNACRRKEYQLSLQVWHFLQDLCILNAFQVYLKLHQMKLIEVEEGNDGKQSNAMKLREFKRQLACALCSPYAELYQQGKRTPKSGRKKGTPPSSGSVPASAVRSRAGGSSLGSVEGDDDETANAAKNLIKYESALHHHIFTVNPDKNSKRGSKHRGVCHLCRIMGDTATANPLTVYGCVQCQKCFHPECFSLYHNYYNIKNYNDECKKIHDRLDEYHSENPHVLDWNVEGYDTPTEKQKEKAQKGICAKENQVRKFG